MSTNYFFVAWQ